MQSTCSRDVSIFRVKIDTFWEYVDEVDMSNWKADKPHNNLPLLPPKEEVEAREVWKACVEARAAIAGVKQACGLLPNPGILINTIPLLEAQASSEIENIVTTTDKLFLYANTQEKADKETQEALRYRAALYTGIKLLKKKPFCVQTAIDICREIKGIDLNIRKTPGTKLINDSTGKVIYTPPEGEELLRELLSNWERYAHAKDDVDPLIKMAVLHYQFEAIHPFIDGNGRTGRVLNLLYLIEVGLLNEPILYLSGYINRNRTKYYEGLIGVTAKGNWTGWISFILQGIQETAEWTTSLVESINKLIQSNAKKVRKEKPNIYSKELIEAIFVQPYCRINDLIALDIAKRETASNYLKALCDLHLLKEIQFGREKVFINSQLISLMKSSL